jgi:pectate lyase
LGIALLAAAEGLAFPGAEGAGKASLGGRGGAVVFVTSLADSGSGTLRAALERPGPRTVVFRIGGTITLESPLVISEPYVTVAGQTAPGGGIQIRNNPVAPYGLAADSFASLVITAHDVVIRYLRIRPGPLDPNPACTGPNAVLHPDGVSTCVDANDVRAIQIEPGARRILLDHLSLSWAVDKVLAVIGANRVTLQWSIVAEGLDFVLYEGFFGKTAPYHGQGTITGNVTSARAGQQTGRLAFHHNLFSQLMARAPQMIPNCPFATQPLACASDVVNNYVYGWDDYGASIANTGGHSFVNVVGNYFRAGRDTRTVERALLLSDWGTSAVVPEATLGVHQSGNRIRISQGVSGTLRPSCARWNAALGRFDPCDPASYSRPRYATAPITTTGAITARDQVLAQAGASARLDASGFFVPARDSVDARIVTDATLGTGRIIDSPAAFPGWPGVSTGTPPADHDRDGMPDAFEDRFRCLDARRIDHAIDADADTYTNLEEYLNGTPPCGS